MAVLAAVFLLALMPVQALAKYASIVIDARTGQVLHAANADTRLFPASLTKMMTLYMTFEALEAGKLTLNTRLPVSRRAEGMAPTKLGLRAGQTIRVEDAILGLVIRSANDASVVLAEALAGTEVEFARQMTEKARSLGMTRTTFRNASGLPNAGQLSTVRDMARLAQALVDDHGEHYHFFSRRSFTYAGVTMNSHNRLMARYDGMDGLKTGFTNASGFNLASSVVRDGRRLVGVVFGGQTARWRDDHMASLLDRAFEGRSAPVLVASAPAARRAATATAEAARAPVPARKPGQAETDVAATVVRVAGAIATGAGELALPKPAVAGTLAAPMPAVAPGGWGIQVGAFNNQTAGQRAVATATQRASGLLDSAIPHVVEVKASGNTLYRARLMGLDEKTARRACSRLSKGGIGCVTVPPQRGS
ncbi:MAG: D-alanyl-D-alanine carboxypeptidase [Pseudomonadota bacterium]